MKAKHLLVLAATFALVSCGNTNTPAATTSEPATTSNPGTSSAPATTSTPATSSAPATTSTPDASSEEGKTSAAEASNSVEDLNADLAIAIKNGIKNIAERNNFGLNLAVSAKANVDTGNTKVNVDVKNLHIGIEGVQPENHTPITIYEGEGSEEDIVAPYLEAKVGFGVDSVSVVNQGTPAEGSVPATSDVVIAKAQNFGAECYLEGTKAYIDGTNLQLGLDTEGADLFGADMLKKLASLADLGAFSLPLPSLPEGVTYADAVGSILNVLQADDANFKYSVDATPVVGMIPTMVEKQWNEARATIGQFAENTDFGTYIPLVASLVKIAKDDGVYSVTFNTTYQNLYLVSTMVASMNQGEVPPLEELKNYLPNLDETGYLRVTLDDNAFRTVEAKIKTGVAVGSRYQEGSAEPVVTYKKVADVDLDLKLTLSEVKNIAFPEGRDQWKDLMTLPFFNVTEEEEVVSGSAVVPGEPA